MAGLKETFDKDRRDLIIRDILPSNEEAYATIQREIASRKIMGFEKKYLKEDMTSINTGPVTAKNRLGKTSFRRGADTQKKDVSN